MRSWRVGRGRTVGLEGGEWLEKSGEKLEGGKEVLQGKEGLERRDRGWGGAGWV